MRALITGMRGFTGRYVAAELERAGWDVVGLGTREDPEDRRYSSVNLADAGRLRDVVFELRPDAVVHLAAVAFVAHRDVDAFYRVNLIGTRNLLAALAACGKRPECVLLASSANVYGNGSGERVAENSALNPDGDYAVSKLAMEYMARLWMDKLPIVITRPFNYTGVGQVEDFLLPKIVAHFRRRAETIELGNLDVWRDFSDVRAVANAYRRLLELRPVGETVNVCSGRTHSLRDLVAIAERVSGHTMRVEVNPALVRANEARSLCGDPSRLRRLIGECDSPPLEETLSWMLST